MGEGERDDGGRQAAQGDGAVKTRGPAEATQGEAEDRGREAERVREIPARGWKDVLTRVKAESKKDNASLLSAGVAFYMLIALVPGLVALVSIYGLVANPSDVETQVEDLLGTAPQEVRDLINQQLSSITESSSTAVSLGVIIGIALALWSAASGTKHLIEAINAAYDEEEGRGFVKLTSLSLTLTLGAIAFLIIAVALIAFLPAVLSELTSNSAVRWLVGGVRWVLLAGGMIVALSILYRYAPDRDNPRWRWASFGAIVATVVWVIGSALFSFYAANFGKYNETYGSLGAVVVVMLWLFLTGFAIIFGAEINAELERQTARDTTEGPEQPMGERGAEPADTVGATADEVKAHAKKS